LKAQVEREKLPTESRLRDKKKDQEFDLATGVFQDMATLGACRGSHFPWFERPVSVRKDQNTLSRPK
jgi:hypothetical protein